MIFHIRTPRPFRDLAHKLEILVKGKLWLQALLGLGLGLGLGIFLGPDVGRVDPARAAMITEWLALPGELFLRLIKMVLLPLLVTSIIRGLGGTTNPQKLRRVGGAFFLYVMFTSTVASGIGLLLASIVQPGKYVTLPSHLQAPHGNRVDVPAEINVVRDLPDAIVSLIPVNPLEAAINGEMLGVVIFAVIIGFAFAMRRNEKIEPLLRILDGILDVCMTIVRFAMFLVPLAVFGLIARMASQVGIATLLGMGVYVLTVLGGLFVLLLFYLCIVAFFGHLSPITFLQKAAPAQLLAFSTSSSAAVMPLSVKIAEEELHADEETTKVIVPLGATINMDGTALYQSVAVLFMAQIAGIELTLMQMALIVVTLVLSSIGAPATPGVGMVILTSVASSFGIPMSGQALLLGVDRILDMSRTALNVTGDLTACVIFGRKDRRWWQIWRRSTWK
jgi:Na+/H+-dicarboxylate symporter